MLTKMTPDELREASAKAGSGAATFAQVLREIIALIPQGEQAPAVAKLEQALNDTGIGLPGATIRDHLVAAGRKGGLARKASITKRRARAIARKAAKASWVSRRAKAAKGDECPTETSA